MNINLSVIERINDKCNDYANAECEGMPEDVIIDCQIEYFEEDLSEYLCELITPVVTAQDLINEIYANEELKDRIESCISSPIDSWAEDFIDTNAVESAST